MKRLSALFLAVTMIFALSACGGSPSSSTPAAFPQGTSAESPAADPITMKLGLTFADNHLITQELYAMSDAVKERTNGGITIEIYATPY